MRNLRLRYSTVHNTNVVNPKFIVLDSGGSNKSTVYICTDEQLISYNFETETAAVLTDVIGVVSCEYLSLENEICIATEQGDVFLFNPETNTTNEVTFCDGGIEKMVWSPDQEVVAFITKARSLVVMTCTFEPISEVQLDEDNFGENAFISVGWGKKETQFHGSEGKAAAKQKSNFVLPENLSELPQEINIIWRADGAFFAVSFVGPNGRMFKVFDKEGSQKSTSEKLNDLWPAIAWRPSGNWVAVPHKFPNKCTIGLFEKNGLRHREIILPFQFDIEPVVDLKWSDDSDILAIQTLLEGKTNLYLYTIGNYHWYLKQVLCFDGILSTLVWDNRVGGEKTMFVMMSTGRLIRYSWTFDIDRCQVYSGTLLSGKKSALVAVIDGKKLLMTDFRKGVTPPPMSTWQLECDSYINSCIFLLRNKTPGEAISFFVCTAKNELQLYRCPKNENPKLLKKVQLEPRQNPLSYHYFLWLEDTKVCWVENNERGTELCHFSLIDNCPAATWKSVGVICYLEAVDEFNILAHTTDGRVSNIMFLRSGDVGKVTDNCSTGGMCDHIQFYERKGISGVISLGRQCLRCDLKTIATGVTSFYLTSNYLVFTQLAVMKFWRLDTGKVVNERKIERGAKIVMIVPNDSLTILQLPRGNLETIHPRVLCLDLVGDLLDEAQYLQAMNLVRRQRINLNIICDHDLGKFLQNVNKFLTEVDAQWLNLFLTDLQNEDFTQTMYSSNYQDTERKYPEGFRVENKISFICSKMSEEMLRMGLNKYLLPTITANVKIGSMEKALEMIWEEKKKETAAGEGVKESKAEDALKYLLYLVDVNQLYDVALGMYDFGLVLMVAKKSQKDPREFLPFLNELKVLDEHYRKFRIDFHLKRFSKALVNISRCGEERFPEALQLVKANGLYQDALSAYKEQPECYQRIAHAFGDYLREHGKFENASLMYERAGNLAQAVACARHILDWQRCLALTKKEGLYPQDVATSLVPPLMEQGRYEDAFELLKRYGNSFAEGITCLLKGNLYLKAIFEARMENINVLKSVILPHLLSYKTTLEANLNGDRELYLHYKNRLLAIRETKLKDATLDDLDESTQVDECDLLSDTTSMHSSRYTGSSRGTGKTFRSSKNRRKHERKLLSLKEGNPFEDIALIDALHNHVLKVYALQMHIRDTCKALLEVCEDVQAQALQRQFKSLLLLIRESLDEIWTPEITVTAQYISGPNVDYAALQNEQRYAMINPVKRFKPQLNLVDWEHEILR